MKIKDVTIGWRLYGVEGTLGAEWNDLVFKGASGILFLVAPGATDAEAVEVELKALQRRMSDSYAVQVGQHVALLVALGPQNSALAEVLKGHGREVLEPGEAEGLGAMKRLMKRVLQLSTQRPASP
jgi:hypothetical protein